MLSHSSAPLGHWKYLDHMLSLENFYLDNYNKKLLVESENWQRTRSWCESRVIDLFCEYIFDFWWDICHPSWKQKRLTSSLAHTSNNCSRCCQSITLLGSYSHNPHRSCKLKKNMQRKFVWSNLKAVIVPQGTAWCPATGWKDRSRYVGGGGAGHSRPKVLMPSILFLQGMYMKYRIHRLDFGLEVDKNRHTSSRFGEIIIRALQSFAGITNVPFVFFSDVFNKLGGSKENGSGFWSV